MWYSGLGEGFNNILFKNPVSSTVIDSLRAFTNTILFKESSSSATTPKLPPALQNLPVSRLVLSGNLFVRLAGVSGASAVVLGAYGAHTFYSKADNEEKKNIYKTANLYHFIHTLALLGAPLSRFPTVAGSLLLMGTVLFCGTCYYDAFTGRTELRKFTPVGGTCLIFGWLCLVI